MSDTVRAYNSMTKEELIELLSSRQQAHEDTLTGVQQELSYARGLLEVVTCSAAFHKLTPETREMIWDEVRK